MNNEIQANDVIESLKSIIADQAYKIAYREAMIVAYERQIKELNEVLAMQRNVNNVEVNKNDDVR